MNYFDKMLLAFLNQGALKLEISGFDQEAFKEALHDALKLRLETIEYIIFEDSDVISDAKKVLLIKELFRQEFYEEE